MPIQVKILADSISPQGRRLTTFQYQAHRWILAEINTHKMISKNARSSRAVPNAKLIEEVRNDPALPVFWGKNKTGMVAVEEMLEHEARHAEDIWRKASYSAITHATHLANIGLHKQTVNRLLEPFMWAYGVLTATDWGNFFALRTAPDAQPEFKALADQMLAAYEASQPKLLIHYEWHLPYVTEAEYQTHSLETLKMLSAARVARVSYKPFDGDDSVEKELSRAKLLIGGGHWSPFEHQGTPDYVDGVTIWNGENVPAWEQPHLHGNFHGWIQLRKTFGGENRQHPSCDR
jgi:hypothetical protein